MKDRSYEGDCPEGQEPSSYVGKISRKGLKKKATKKRTKKNRRKY